LTVLSAFYTVYSTKTIKNRLKLSY